MRSRLLWKLVGGTIPVIAVAILVMWLSIDYLAADYFTTLMQEYNISPTDAHRMFLDAVHRYLLWASLGALLCAGLVSVVLTRKILAPLARMTEVSRQIAAGEYTARIRSGARDEVGELATAFNRMIDSLRRIERLRRTLVIDVAHELRTPLTTLRGYLEALRDGVATPCRETFDLLHEETLRLVTLVEDMLRLAKADAARTTLRRRRVVLQDVVEPVLDMFQPQLVAKEIMVDTVGMQTGAVVLADADKLAQAVRNLLQNAWQYTPPGGTVRITTAWSAAGLTLTVINTGEGIPEADLPFIFERFYRGDKSRSRDRGGAGIGLAIVKELVEAHGGQVGATSSATETRIWLTLPAAGCRG